MRSFNGTLLVVAGLLALGLVVGMALTGAPPGLQSYVPFAPSGLMAETPDQITRLDLQIEGRRLAFVRTQTGRWHAAEPPGTITSDALATHLDAAVRFMHVSAPVRTISPSEYSAGDLAHFGLDPPRYVVSLSSGWKQVLESAFGSTNPMMTSQYVRVRDRQDVYLLPRFVGREWELVATSADTAGGSTQVRR